MKKWILVTAAVIILSSSGCINSARYNEAQDDIWIQQQLDAMEERESASPLP